MEPSHVGHLLAFLVGVRSNEEGFGSESGTRKFIKDVKSSLAISVETVAVIITNLDRCRFERLRIYVKGQSQADKDKRVSGRIL